MPHIISGSHKGRKLATLAGDRTRPSSGKLKEAYFSIVQARLPGACFLDVFAGSGQMGLEALSRGAERALFLEKDGRAFRILQANLEACHFADRALAQRGNSLTLLPALLDRGFRFDLVYVDPPWDRAGQLLDKLGPVLLDLLRPSGLLTLELDEDQEELGAKIPWPPVKTCHYGRAMLLFYKIQEDSETAEESGRRPFSDAGKG